MEGYGKGGLSITSTIIILTEQTEGAKAGFARFCASLFLLVQSTELEELFSSVNNKLNSQCVRTRITSYPDISQSVINCKAPLYLCHDRVNTLHSKIAERTLGRCSLGSAELVYHLRHRTYTHTYCASPRPSSYRNREGEGGNFMFCLPLWLGHRLSSTGHRPRIVEGRGQGSVLFFLPPEG